MATTKPHTRIIPWVLELLHRRLRPRTSVLEGVRIQICPHVFNPLVSGTTRFFIRHMIIPRGSRVLELGTGTGAIAAFAARYAKRVVATDINPYSVKCAKETIRLNRLESVVDVKQGNLFEPVQRQRFDLILFNPPYLTGKPRDLLAQAWYAGPQCKLIYRFLVEAPRNLTKKGRIQILFSSVAPLQEILHMIEQSNFQLEILATGRLLGFLETLYLFQLR